MIIPPPYNALVFSNVITGSEARHAAQQYTWQEKGGAMTLTSDSPAGKMQSTCHRVEHQQEQQDCDSAMTNGLDPDRTPFFAVKFPGFPMHVD